jgi:hypothetical protein
MARAAAYWNIWLPKPPLRITSTGRVDPRGGISQHFLTVEDGAGRSARGPFFDKTGEMTD